MALRRLAESVTTNQAPWRTCQVCHALASIPPDEAQGLRDILKSGMRYSVIADLIAADPDTPLNISRDALSRHARGLCEAREKLR